MIILTPINYEELAYNYITEALKNSDNVLYKEWCLIFATIERPLLSNINAVSLANDVARKEYGQMDAASIQAEFTRQLENYKNTARSSFQSSNRTSQIELIVGAGVDRTQAEQMNETQLSSAYDVVLDTISNNRTTAFNNGSASDKVNLTVDLKTSNSEKVRYNAARVLGEMGDSKAVEPLIDVLKHDKNGSVRLYAARALGELGDSKATIHLIESLREDRNVDVRVRAARALGRLGGEIVVEPLVEALNDENPQVCITATDALIEIGDVATDALMESLDHEKVNVRCDATRALGEIGNKKAVDKVINMLYDEWVNVRIYAVTSLGKLNDTKAVPALIDVMKNRNENELVRAGAAAALGVLRDQRALLPLRELIMEAEELGELEDTALKSFKKIMAANWQSIPGAAAQKKPANAF